jgi:hypothetical protein
MATDMDIDMGLDMDIGQEYSNLDIEQVWNATSTRD